MGEGPTLVGSIIAELDLDMKKWDVKVGEIKEQAKEVGALSPEIKVDANVGPALAKLNSVVIAEQRLETATRQAANSASTAYIASERLKAMQEKRGATELQLAAATESSARADRNAEAAEMKLIAATAALNTVQRESINRSSESAGATDNDTAATNRNVQANHRRVSGLQVLVAMSPLILSAAAPIGAAAVGLGAAFGVMGVSGVLAIKGIKDAMEVGDTVGNQYAAGIGVLKGNLDTLSAVSANAMLASFNGAVGDINSRMPFLNQLVREGSGLLGQMGGTALSGVLNGLQQMNPLIQQGGVELGKFVTWLFSFTGSNGFSEFLAYAGANLPAVMTLIESLVTTAGHIIAAFAPLGPVVIGVLTAISDGLSALPLPVLAGLVTSATLLGPAMTIAGAGMKIAGTEAALFGMQANLAVPVVGILLAALAGLGIMAASAAQGTDHGTASMENYTQALRDDTNAIGDHVRAQAAKALVDSGASEAARTLGVSIADVTSAATGNTDALNRLKAVQKDASMTEALGIANGNLTDQQSNAAKAADTLMNAVQGTNGAITDGIQKNKDYDAALAATKPGIDANTAAATLQAGAYGATVQMYQSATTAQQSTATELANTTLKMQLQNDAAGLLKMALDGLNGKAISAAQAQNAFDSSLVNMGDHVDKTGKKITFTTTSIDDMSSASVALRGQLNGQVTNLQNVVEANGGLSESTGKAKAEMETMRTQIIDNAVAHGVDKDAVTAYVDNLLTIPKSVPPTKVDIDKAEAELKLQGFQSAIDRLTGKTVHIYSIEHIQQVRDGPAVNGVDGNSIANSMDTANAYATGSAYRAEGGPIYRAGGGMVNYLAGGGHPGVPRGTDTVPAWLTPDEFVMQRASAKSIGAPALNYMNQTGQLPPGSGQASGPMQLTGTLVLDSGEMLGTFRGIVQESLDGVSRQVGGMRR